MKDGECVELLQWALPKMRMRWRGFRKVRAQVRKRVQRRMRELGLADVTAYRDYLANHPGEWTVLGSLCRVTISRFYRDREVFRVLETMVLPEIANRLQKRGSASLRVWSAGCGSGEEPYTVSILWRLALQARYPDLRLSVLATDIDRHMIRRAQLGCYSDSSLKDLPTAWRERAFSDDDRGYCLAAEYRSCVSFACQDLQADIPSGPFDLILCRNLVFTYFNINYQAEILKRLSRALVPHGILVVGAHETLPPGTQGFSPVPGARGCYRRRGLSGCS